MKKLYYSLLLLFVSNISFATGILNITHATTGELAQELDMAIPNDEDLINYSHLIIEGGILDLADCKVISEKLSHIQSLDFRLTSFIGDSIPSEIGDGPGTGTFSTLTSMNLVEFPDNLTLIGNYTFSHCTGLKEVGFGTDSQLEKIGAYAFCETTSMVLLDFLANLKIIGDYAFYQSMSIKTIYLPKSVTQIGDYAFHNCIALEDVYAPWESPISIGEHAFEGAGTIWGNLKSIDLYVPEGSEGIYLDHSTWGQLNIQRNLPTNLDESESLNNYLKYDFKTNILNTNNERTGLLKIFNLKGQMISFETLSAGENRLDLGFLTKGIYLINTENRSLKIIKQ